MTHVIRVDTPTPCSEPDNRYPFDRLIEITVGRPETRGDSSQIRNLTRAARRVCAGCGERAQCLEVHGADLRLGVIAGATDEQRAVFFGGRTA